MNVLKSFSLLFEDVLSIAFPNNCVLCHQSLFESEETICYQCIQSLPLTHYYKHIDNPTAQLFWGRCEIANCASHFFMNKHNHVHDLIHLLKYRNKRTVGVRLGKLIGTKLKSDESIFTKQDFIIPVPLHFKKERLRGYNQSFYIAKGIGAATGWNIMENNLIRQKENISQTKKTKYERWDNVDGIFKLKNSEKLADKNVLLVDDVITTGSTLEACVHALKKASGIKISIASVATAGD